jgi:hypothetical protein
VTCATLRCRGIQKYGVGKWAEIHEHYEFDERSKVDLKDKWRNMVRNREPRFVLNLT